MLQCLQNKQLVFTRPREGILKKFIIIYNKKERQTSLQLEFIIKEARVSVLGGIETINSPEENVESEIVIGGLEL